MYLKEEFTENQCQDIFTDMIDEFSDCYDLDLYFDASIINPKLDWLNANNRKVMGLCRSRGYRQYGDMVVTSCSILLNPNMLKFEDDGLLIIKNTLAHELCHTCKGCQNHGPQFHKVAEIIKRNMGYVIDTRADLDASAYFNKYLPQTKYKLVCQGCGIDTYIARLSDPVKNPGKYHCSKCGGNIASYILNNSGEYDLFRSPEDEPDYKHNLVCSNPNCGYRVGFKTATKTYKDVLRLMLNGGSVDCPKCRLGTLYAIEDGREITTGDLFDNMLMRNHVSHILGW